MKKAILLIHAFLLIAASNAQQIRGKVLNERSNAPVQGLKVIYSDSSYEASTDAAGEFLLPQGKAGKIEISGANYQTVLLDWNGISAADLQIRIKPSSEDINTVTITHDRLKEKLRESPVTVESLNAKAIKETPASDFYEGLGHLRGVDVTAASLGFRIINTRGFNSTSPVRSLQLIDGVDNQAPGLNFSLGNFLGCSELDVANTEIVVGASSAYFGPNAFNGAIIMTSKSPWTEKGLSAQVKIGERELGQVMVRYANSYRNKAGRDIFAWKANLCYMRAYDWVAQNTAAATDSRVGVKNPGGYDAVNRYGDEIYGTASSDQVSKGLEWIGKTGLGGYCRDGYWEKDLVNYNTRNLKTNLVLAYKINAKNELQYGFNFGTGTTVYQGDNRYSLNDVLFFQNRLEWIGKTGFLRAYATHEDAGNTYDAVYTAFLMQQYVKKGDDWTSDYGNYWSNYIRNKVKKLPGFDTLNSSKYFFAALPGWLEWHRDSITKYHEMARAAANRDVDYQGLPRTYTMYDKLIPGTPEFDRVKKEITSKNSYISDGVASGSRFFDKSALYHLTGEKRFNAKDWKFTLGFSSRLYTPNSHGTIFLDTGNNKITNWEAGIYAGIEKRFFEKKLKVNATTRVDKNQNFNVLVSPAVSFIYSKTKLNTYRISFSSAIRNPTLQDQYLHYNVGRALLLGNIHGFKHVLSVDDIRAFLNTQNPDTLRFFDVAPIKPEQVKTIEVGYKGFLLKNKLALDAGYYYSYYTNFIGYKVVVDADIDYTFNWVRSAQAYRVAANSADAVTTQGFSMGFNYFFWKYYMINGNYSLNILDRHGSSDPIIPAFNTPKNKFNVGIGASDISDILKLGNRKIRIRNFGFNTNFKWVQGFLFEGSPQFTGYVPRYCLLDVQISQKILRWNTTFKMGASNVLNNKVYQVYGGPAIGRMAYISLTYEPK